MTALIISALCLNQSTRSHLPAGARDGQNSQREMVLLGFGNRAYPGTDQSALNVQHKLASADLGLRVVDPDEQDATQVCHVPAFPQDNFRSPASVACFEQDTNGWTINPNQHGCSSVSGQGHNPPCWRERENSSRRRRLAPPPA